MDRPTRDGRTDADGHDGQTDARRTLGSTTSLQIHGAVEVVLVVMVVFERVWNGYNFDESKNGPHMLCSFYHNI